MLATLFNALKAGVAGNDVEIMASTYKMALNGIAYEVLAMAVEDLVLGKAEGLSATFMPTTAQLRQYCDRIQGKMNSWVKYAKRLLEADEVAPRGQRVSGERMAALMDTMGNAPANQTRH